MFPSRISRFALSLVPYLCLLVMAGAEARAQPAEAQPPPPNADAVVRARELFASALAHVDQGAFEQAVSEFEQAYQAHPHPGVLYNLGLAYARADRPLDAVDTLERYLTESGDGVGAQRRAFVGETIDAQLRRLAEIQIVTVPSEARVQVDDRELPLPLPGAIRLLPGPHQVRISSDGHAPNLTPLELSAGEKRTLVVSLAKLEAPAAVTGVTGDTRRVNTENRPRATGERPQPSRATTPLDTLPADATSSNEVLRTTSYVTGIVGLTAIVAAAGVYAWSSARYDSWQSTQRDLDVQWARGAPYPSDLGDRQARNDNLSQDIQAGDRWVVGLAAGGGALLVVAIPLFLSTTSTSAGPKSAGPTRSTGLAANAGRVTWTHVW